MNNNQIFTYEVSDAHEEQLAKILGQITHHIHPCIVKYIAEKNKDYKDRFPGNCNTDPFFYPDSDCVFPGVRRPINNEKTGVRRPINSEKTDPWKNNFYTDGTILNDNTFPRHIWAYLSVNKGYSGGTNGSWASSGLDKFELAHVFSHKEDGRSHEKEKLGLVFDECKTEPYGLFTSASNVVLIPKGFAKPTDHMEKIKICFYQRHLDLYGKNIIGLTRTKYKLPGWYKNIEWLKPKKPDDWKDRIDKLLTYREEYLKNKWLTKTP